MIFNRGIDTMKITALSNHKPGILNNYIRIKYLCVKYYGWHLKFDSVYTVSKSRNIQNLVKASWRPILYFIIPMYSQNNIYAKQLPSVCHLPLVFKTETNTAV